jgi:aspartate kinase
MPMLLKDLQERFVLRYNDNVELITIRHYNESKEEEVIKDRKILLEQKSRSTRQVIVKKR